MRNEIGDYPGNHRMPVLSDVLYQAMTDGDEILSAPAKRKSASLTIRFRLKRPPQP
jgi:hypothetical protein